MIAVVGCGYWGKNLVRNFHALGVLRAICDQRAATLESFSTDFPGVRASQALADVLADPEVTGVAIATPAETHFTLAREALLAGKHVFVEKPLATLESEGAALVRIARDRGLVLMVGHLLRYHPGFITLQQMVRDGELGRLNYIYSQRLNLGKVRREENILWSFAPHDVSMILALAGGLPETATAIGGNYLHKRIADVTVTHLDFASGLKAHIFVSWLHPFKVQNLVVIGDKRMAVFDDTLPWERKLLVYPLEIHWHEGVPVPSKAPSTAVALEQAEPLRKECEHFVACVRSGTSPRTDGSEGMAVLHVLNACQRSLDSGRSQAIDAQYQETAPDFFVHPTSLVDAGSTIGKGSKIWHFSHVLGGCSIGEGCNIGQNVVVGPDVRIGDGCKVQNNVSLYKGVTLEDDVFCGPSMVFTNVFNPRAHIRRMDELRQTLVRRGATLGANSTIVCGVTIGRHAFVGAGAVVTRSVPDHALVVGNPARRTGWVCSCGCKLDKALACTACGLRYQATPDGLALLESSTSGEHRA